MRDRYVEQYKPDIRTESSTDNFDEDEKIDTSAKRKNGGWKIGTAGNYLVE